MASLVRHGSQRMSANVTPDLLGRFVTTMLPFGDLASLDGHELGVANLTSVMRVYRSTVFGNTLAPASSVKVGVRGGLHADVAVARAAGLHTSRIDGSALAYNQPDPKLPDLVVCRPELAAAVLAVTTPNVE